MNTDETGADNRTVLTPGRRRVALIALLFVVFLFAARPMTLRFGDDGPTASCGLVTFIFGADEPATTRACRDAFAGRANAALILLGGIVLLASEFVPKRDTATVSPPAREPGEDPSVLGGLRRATVDPSFAIFAGLGIGMLAVLGIVLRPVEVQASVLGGERIVGCGFADFLFGAQDAVVTAACRQAYAPRAAGGFVVLLAVGVAVAMIAWIVQYHRGAALGSVWHRADAPTSVLAWAGGGCVVLAVLALFAAAGGAQ
jgi:hypothetical protein